MSDEFKEFCSEEIATKAAEHIYAVPVQVYQGNRHFMANCVSYFLIYRWASKNPFRPLRF